MKDIAEALFARIRGVLGRSIEDSEYKSLIDDLKVSPRIKSEPPVRLYEFLDQGFAFIVTETGVVFAARFAYDSKGTRSGELKPFADRLLNGVDRDDARETVHQKMGGQPVRSQVVQDGAGSSRWLQTDWYLIDGAMFIFSFDAETVRLAGLQIFRVDSVPPVSEIGGTSFAPPRDTSDPAKILGQVGNLYAACSTYQDQGFVEDSKSGTTLDQSRTRLLFKTVFRRPDNFLFEWIDLSDTNDDGRAEANVVWFYAGTVESMIRGKRETYVSIQEALRAAAVMTSGASCLIPALLIPNLEPPSHSRITDLEIEESQRQLFKNKYAEDSDAPFLIAGLLKPGNGAVINIARGDLRITHIRIFDMLSALTSPKVAAAILEVAPPEVRTALEKLQQLADSEPAGLHRSYSHFYQDVLFNADIEDTRFFWKPGSYSELEWAKRNLRD